MFIAIATDDFDNTFSQNNESEVYHAFTTDTDYPIFTGETVDVVRERIERYFSVSFDPDEYIPEYEICEITTVAISKASYKLVTELSRINS